MLRNTTFAGVFSTLCLLIYTLVAAFGYSYLAMILFLISPVLVLWLVYTVLRYGEPSGRTFDEYFYDDADIRADQLRK